MKVVESHEPVYALYQNRLYKRPINVVNGSHHNMERRQIEHSPFFGQAFQQVIGVLGNEIDELRQLPIVRALLKNGALKMPYGFIVLQLFVQLSLRQYQSFAGLVGLRQALTTLRISVGSLFRSSLLKVKVFIKMYRQKSD